MLILGALASTACSADFTRDDAIAAVQTTGVTEAEATCITDSLAALDQLDAADPRQPRTEDRREAFVAATGRCIAPEVLGASSSVDDQLASVGVDSTGSTFVNPDEQSVEEQRASRADAAVDAEQIASNAIAELQRQGRSEVNATCIVDLLRGTRAEYLFASPDFGLGLDPLEANAIAACLSRH